MSHLDRRQLLKMLGATAVLLIGCGCSIIAVIG